MGREVAAFREHGAVAAAGLSDGVLDTFALLAC